MRKGITVLLLVLFSITATAGIIITNNTITVSQEEKNVLDALGVTEITARNLSCSGEECCFDLIAGNETVPKCFSDGECLKEKPVEEIERLFVAGKNGAKIFCDVWHDFSDEERDAQISWEVEKFLVGKVKEQLARGDTIGEDKNYSIVVG